MLGSGGRRENPKGSVRPARTGAQTSLSDQGAKELDLGAEDPEKGGFGLNVLLHPRASSGLSKPFPLSPPANRIWRRSRQRRKWPIFQCGQNGDRRKVKNTDVACR